MRFLPSAALLLVLPSVLGCGKGPDGPNILVITLDTTRRDRLGMYGYSIPTSPNLDRLAQDSVVYTNAYAVSSWTLPTHASMFTGKLPSAHGASYDPTGPLNLGEGIGKEFGGYRARPIAEGETTLAMILAEQGYATGGVIAGPWLLERFRLGKGFEHWDDDGVTALNGRPAEDVTRAALEFVDDHADEPFFLFLNYYDPHNPWHDEPPLNEQGQPTRPPKPFHEDLVPLVVPPGFDWTKIDYRAFASFCYDAEIRYMDREIGRLLDHLKLRGLYESTWIWVLSDHGELLGEPVLWDPEKARVLERPPAEDGTPRASLRTEPGLWGHGDSLTEPEIHIPFFVKGPGPSPRTGTDASPVLQTDILPTILRELGLPLPPNVQGVPLGAKHLILAELTKLPMMNLSGKDKPPKDWRHLGDWRVLFDGSHKYGWSSNGTPFLVDLAADPKEARNLVASEPALAHRLDQALAAYLHLLPKPGATGEVQQPTPEDLELLKGLGYIGEGE
jgi:arylsulfatase A-like enzyme